MKSIESTQDAAQESIDIQNASNLSAVVRSWAEAIQFARHDGDWGHWMHHPINVLYLSKILSLMCVDGDCLGGVNFKDQDIFRKSYTWVKENR